MAGEKWKAKAAEPPPNSALLPPPSLGSPSHSLCYFYLRLSEPSQGLPQFFIRGYLDNQPIIHFDSLTRKMEPLVPWMEEMEMDRFLSRGGMGGRIQLCLRRGILDPFHSPPIPSGSLSGLHTWQVNLGCELREDGSKGGFLHYGYNGMDFISFDKETLRWVTAQPQAQKVKEKWEEDPRWSQGNKIFLEETCIERLQRYLGGEGPPVGKVTHKEVNERLEVLTCQAFGFHPKEIQATWRRDGEVWKDKTLHRNVAPNSDGTYYERDRFRCHLEHKGLQEPLDLAFLLVTGKSHLQYITSCSDGRWVLWGRGPMASALACSHTSRTDKARGEGPAEERATACLAQSKSREMWEVFLN
uniref:Ig-like domain-containing protein n=1 Tax=Naja naja TaxID=35670 RepID=A0A8C7E0J2_NAJNA